MVKFRLGNALALARLRVGGAVPEEALAVVEEVAGDGGRIGAEVRTRLGGHGTRAKKKRARADSSSLAAALGAAQARAAPSPYPLPCGGGEGRVRGPRLNSCISTATFFRSVTVGPKIFVVRAEFFYSL